MNEKELFDELLNLTKNLCDVSLHGAIEASTNEVNYAFNDVLNTSLKCQNAIYKAMESKDWYKMEEISNQEILKTKEKFL